MEKPRGRVLMVGSSNAGKTTFVTRLAGLPSGITEPTIGCDYSSIKRADDVLQVWDVSGQERYAPFLRLYLPKSEVIVIVFDVTDLQSFEVAKATYDRILLKKNEIASNAHIVLMGNKVDLVASPDAVIPKTEVSRLHARVAEEFACSLHFVSSRLDSMEQLSTVIPMSEVPIDDVETEERAPEYPPHITVATAFCNSCSVA